LISRLAGWKSPLKSGLGTTPELSSGLMTTGSGETPERDTVYVGMVFGMVLLILMQALGTVVANAIWNRRIGVNA
jgi:hypothetical protein